MGPCKAAIPASFFLMGMGSPACPDQKGGGNSACYRWASGVLAYTDSQECVRAWATGDRGYESGPVWQDGLPATQAVFFSVFLTYDRLWPADLRPAPDVFPDAQPL